MHKTTHRFRKLLKDLPLSIQKLAKERFTLLKENPSHPSLHFKKVGKFWSVRITDYHRALAIKNGEDYIWVWIGTHDDYEKLIKKS